MLIATAAIVWLYLGVGGAMDSPAFWGIAAVLLAVALLLGARAWLTTIGLSVGIIYASLVLSVSTLHWEQSDAGVLPGVQVDSAEEGDLAILREQYHLDDVVAGARDDYERVRRLVTWANGRFAHAALTSRRGQTR